MAVTLDLMSVRDVLRTTNLSAPCAEAASLVNSVWCIFAHSNAYTAVALPHVKHGMFSSHRRQGKPHRSLAPSKQSLTASPRERPEAVRTTSSAVLMGWQIEGLVLLSHLLDALAAAMHSSRHRNLSMPRHASETEDYEARSKAIAAKHAQLRCGSLTSAKQLELGNLAAGDNRRKANLINFNSASCQRNDW